MTIRLKTGKTGISRLPAPGDSSGNMADVLIKNMTVRYTRILGDFKKGRLHPLPCICWLCLWRKFEKMRPVGPPYDYLTFLAYDILSEIKCGFEYYEPVANISIRKLAQEVIRRLPIINSETKKVLNEFSRELYKTHFIEYAYRKRYRADKLMNLIERLIYEIDREWKRGQPQPVAIINLKRQTPASLALKVANFVYLQPGHKTTQRELQRYTNKRKADLEAIHEWLKLRYEIALHKKGKSVFYVGTRQAKKDCRVFVELIPKNSLKSHKTT
jgi:hypothetical protein